MSRIRLDPRRSYLSLLLLLWLGMPGRSDAAPTVQSIKPLGTAPGATTELTISGAGLARVARLHTSFGPTADVQLVDDKAERPADKAIFPLAIPADAPLGIQSIRVSGGDGVSSQKLFIIDDLPTAAVDGGGADWEAARDISVPCGVDGVVQNLQRQFFRFDAAAGQRIAFEVLARRLGSTLDPVLVLYRDNGTELASTDDSPGLGGDCQFSHQFTQPGRYVLELRDIRYRGGAGAMYRLRLGDFPCVQAPFPLAVQRGVATSVAFCGLDNADIDPVNVTVPADWPHAWFAIAARRRGGSASGFAMLAVSDRQELQDAEPNDLPDQAQALAENSNVNGRFDKPGDIDRFRFHAAKGARLLFSGETRREGSPTDLVLRLLDSEGKQLARGDDVGVEEGVLNQTFPADGDYVLEVSELLDRGGPASDYRVVIEPYAAGFTLSADGDALSVPQGGAAEIVVQVNRRDYAGEIDLSVEGLPEGVSASPCRVGPNLKQGVVVLSAADKAPRGEFAPLRIVGQARIGDAEIQETASPTDWLRGQWNALSVVPACTRDSLAMATAGKRKLALTVEPAEVVFGGDLQTKVTIHALRGDDYDDEIKLALLPEKGALPDQVTLTLKPIPSKESSITVAFSAKDKAPLGRYSLVVVGTLKHDKATLTEPTPPIQFTLAAPLALNIDAGDARLKRGETATWKIQVERNPALTGAVKIEVSGLPVGVSAKEVELAADQSSAEIEVIAAADAAPAEAKDVKVVASAGDKGKFKAEATLPKVVLE